MAGHLPSRRAFRPDSQYYRTSRRLGLKRRAGFGPKSEGGVWGLAIVLVAVACLAFWWGHHGGGVAKILGYGGTIVAGAAALLVIARR
jgi:hypothetical protein